MRCWFFGMVYSVGLMHAFKYLNPAGDVGMLRTSSHCLMKG